VVYRKDQDQNDESVFKIGPNRHCLLPHVQQLGYFPKKILSRLLRRLSEGDGQPSWSRIDGDPTFWVAAEQTARKEWHASVHR